MIERHRLFMSYCR